MKAHIGHDTRPFATLGIARVLCPSAVPAFSIASSFGSACNAPLIANDIACHIGTPDDISQIRRA